MDDKARIVKAAEELKDKAQHQALVLKDAVADLEPVHIKIASKIIASVRLPKYSASSLS